MVNIHSDTKVDKFDFPFSREYQLHKASWLMVDSVSPTPSLCWYPIWIESVLVLELPVTDSVSSYVHNSCYVWMSVFFFQSPLSLKTILYSFLHRSLNFAGIYLNVLGTKGSHSLHSSIFGSLIILIYCKMMFL